MANSVAISIRPAAGPDDIATVRRLFARYGEYLAANPAGAANLRIQEYDGEFATLPGQYVAHGGALLLSG